MTLEASQTFAIGTKPPYAGGTVHYERKAGI